MTRTFDRWRSAILLCAAMAVLTLLSSGCADSETLSTDTSASAPVLTEPTLTVSTSAPVSTTTPVSTVAPASLATTTTVRPGSASVSATTTPAELARRIPAAATPPTSPYEDLEDASSIADGDTSAERPADDDEPTQGLSDDTDDTIDADSSDSDLDVLQTTAIGDPEPADSGDDDNRDASSGATAVRSNGEPDGTNGGRDTEDGRDTDDGRDIEAAVDRAATTSTSVSTSPTRPVSSPTTATRRRSTSSLPSYVVTAVPRPPSTVMTPRGGRTPSTTSPRRTTPPTFLASPDRSSPIVRRTTTTRRPTTTRPKATTTTTIRPTTTRPPTTTTVPPTTTTTSTTTTTPAPTTIYRGGLGNLDPNAPAIGQAGHLPPLLPASLAPLTGLPVTATNARGAVVVKVDNAGPARPQTGLDLADIVYEERVEGAATRFAAVFHSKGSGSVGPIRSARSTDVGILGSFSRPAFVFSGANDEFRRLVAGQQIVDLGADVWGGYWRSSERRAPYNLYAKLATVWRKAPGVAPRPHFAYRAPGTPSPANAASVRSISVAFDNNKVGYTWHASSGTWRRSQNGRAHNAASGARIAPENVIVQNVTHVETGLTDVTGAAVVEARLVGSGSALIFTNGKVIPAKWSKPSLASITTFVDVSGNAVLLTPGQTWVELADPGATVWG